MPPPAASSRTQRSLNSARSAAGDASRAGITAGATGFVACWRIPPALDGVLGPQLDDPKPSDPGNPYPTSWVLKTAGRCIFMPGCGNARPEPKPSWKANQSSLVLPSMPPMTSQAVRFSCRRRLGESGMSVAVPVEESVDGIFQGVPQEVRDCPQLLPGESVS